MGLQETDLKNYLIIVEKKIIEEYTDIQKGIDGGPSYMVIRNKPIESQLDSFITYGLNGDSSVSKSFIDARKDFLNNSIYGNIVGHRADGSYIISVVGDNLADKSVFDIVEEPLQVESEVGLRGSTYAIIIAYRLKLKSDN